MYTDILYVIGNISISEPIVQFISAVVLVLVKVISWITGAGSKYIKLTQFNNALETFCT